MKRSTYYIFFILIYLSSVGFYKPFGFFSSKFLKFLTYAFITIGFLLVIYNKRKVNYSGIPIYYFFTVLLGILISAFMANIFQNQSLRISIISTLPFFMGYIYYYLLLKFRIPTSKIIKAIIVFVLISMFIYIVNFITFPNIVFGRVKDEYDMTRGIVRLGVVSIELVVLIFFYAINKYQVSKKKLWVGLIVLTGIFVALSLTRQIIVCAFAIGSIMLLRKKNIFVKIFIVAAIALIIYVVLPNIPVFKTMINLTERQILDNKYREENIRLQAYKFYLYEYQTNELTPILGNGVPSIGNSTWGNKFDIDTEANRCFAVDVGWAGFYWYFGAITTVCLLIVFLKATFKKKQNDEIYLTSWMWFLILTSATSGPILYLYQILNISVVLYLIYAKRSRISLTYRLDEKNSINNIKLQ